VSVSPDGAGELTDCVAIVTGAGRGIGAAIATELAHRGAAVALADIDAAAVTTLADHLRASGGPAEPFEVDVASETSVQGLVSTCLARFGRIDLVVNNAAIIHADPLIDLPAAVFSQVMQVNLVGPFNVMRAVARAMAEQSVSPESGRRGLIINIGSAAADIARPFLAAYGASKAGLNHLSRSAAVAFAELQIGVTVLYPALTVRSGTWTQVAQQLADAEGLTAAELEATREFGDAQTVADNVVWIAATPGLELTGQLVEGPDRVRPI